MHGGQVTVRYRMVKNDDCTGILFPEFFQGIQCAAVIRAVSRWLNDNTAGCTEFFLKQLIRRGIRRRLILRVFRPIGKMGRIINVMMTVAGILRNGMGRYIPSGTVWNLNAGNADYNSLLSVVLSQSNQ